MKKAVVAHAGSRDHYQLSLALNEINALQELITDFYSPETLTNIFPYFKKRYKEGLPSSKVFNSYKVLFMQMRQKIKKEHQEHFFRKQDKALSEIALNKALKADSNLYLYSYYAYKAFKDYTGDQKKILFQVHPHPLIVKRILSEEIERVPAAKSSLIAEAEMSLSDDLLEELSTESKLADSIVVASSFTKKSLVENNIDDKLISVIPYGVDLCKFNSQNKKPNGGKLIRLIFVGNIIQRKGVFDLLRAMELLKSKNIKLTLCGRKVDENLINSFTGNLNIEVKLNLSHEQLLRELNQSDIFVFPSLIEGFALVILEAMASGLPIITTNNTSGADIIENGKHGYIVPIRSAEKIVEKIEKMISDNNFYEMGIASEIKAREYTWKLFRQRISKHYMEL